VHVHVRTSPHWSTLGAIGDFESDPWIAAFEANHWRPRIAALTPTSRTSLEAAVVQRALPVFLRWAETHDPDGAELARRCLQILWNSVHSLYDRAQAPIIADYMEDHDPRDRRPPAGVWAAHQSLKWALWHVDSTGLSWESTCLDEGYSMAADAVSRPGLSLEENDEIVRADPKGPG
jgi:hypothetical protein